jgi:3-deoxy-manno-octulosonate cytidylyltransferase (CMP-KDO synthetase)
MFRVVIPSRYGSTRLPGKPLRLIAGRPLIEHVHARAMRSGASEVIIATDDERIAVVCRGFGAVAVLTDVGHASGTDRLAEVARTCGWPSGDIVVNVQGDEPLLPPANVSQVAALLAAEPAAAIATLATPITSQHEFLDPNVVKVVRDERGFALYFSRAPIPWPRDKTAPGQPAAFAAALRHVGLYAYRVAALTQLAALPPGTLEDIERLEQLRALENGLCVAVAIAAEVSGPGVDTEEDLAAVARMVGV